MYSASMQGGVVGRLYPERQEPRLGPVDRAAAAVGSLLAPWMRPGAERFRWIIEAVDGHAPSVETLSDPQIVEASRAIRLQLRREGTTEDLTARVFALVREVAKRRLGMSHLDVQLMGGLVLLRGMVAEMETGEGKTLTATLPACTLALAGVPVHIVTVNDYLAATGCRVDGACVPGAAASP